MPSDPTYTGTSNYSYLPHADKGVVTKGYDLAVKVEREQNASTVVPSVSGFNYFGNSGLNLCTQDNLQHGNTAGCTAFYYLTNSQNN